MDAELDEELASYFDDLVARRQAEGLSLDEARRLARREMGSVPHVKAAVRESWLVSAWDQTREDVRQAWRGLVGTPGLSALAVVTFALGIGSATAILGVLHAALLTPPPYLDPDRLLLVWADMSAAGYPRAPLSGPELQDLRTRTTHFERFGAVWANSITITHDGEPEFVRIGLVTPEFFPVLGVRPLAGRLFEPQDDVEGPPATILLSHRLWQRRFGGDPGIVGRAITVNERPVVVIGVLPEQLPAAASRRTRASRTRSRPTSSSPADRGGAARPALPARRRPHEAGRERRARRARTSIGSPRSSRASSRTRTACPSSRSRSRRTSRRPCASRS